MRKFDEMIFSFKNRILAIILITVSIVSCRQATKSITFVNEQQHRDHLHKMNEINASMLSDFSKYGVHDNSTLSLNFYFVTNDSMKAQHLSEDLVKKGYHTNPIHSSPKDRSLWVLTGNAASVSMDTASVNQWTSIVFNL
jgi:hypothetical protein